VAFANVSVHRSKGINVSLATFSHISWGFTVYGSDLSRGTDKVMQQLQDGISPLHGCQLNAFTG